MSVLRRVDYRKSVVVRIEVTQPREHTLVVGRSRDIRVVESGGSGQRCVGEVLRDAFNVVERADIVAVKVLLRPQERLLGRRAGLQAVVFADYLLGYTGQARRTRRKFRE